MAVEAKNAAEYNSAGLHTAFDPSFRSERRNRVMGDMSKLALRLLFERWTRPTISMTSPVTVAARIGTPSRPRKPNTQARRPSWLSVVGKCSGC